MDDPGFLGLSVEGCDSFSQFGDMADLPPGQLSPAILSPGQMRQMDDNALPPLLELATLQPPDSNQLNNARGIQSMSVQSNYPSTRQRAPFGVQQGRQASSLPLNQMSQYRAVRQQPPVQATMGQVSPPRYHQSMRQSFTSVPMATSHTMTNPRLQMAHSNKNANRKQISGQNILQVPKQPLPAHSYTGTPSYSPGGTLANTFIIPQQFASGVQNITSTTSARPMLSGGQQLTSLPPAHSKQNLPLNMGVAHGRSQDNKPFPAHQPVPAQKVQYITSPSASSVITLPQPILIPAISSTSGPQNQQSFVVTGNQMIAQPNASSGPVYVAVPSTNMAAHHTLTTTNVSTTTPATHQQRPLMIRAQIPQQVMRLAPAHSPVPAGARPQQFAFIQRQPAPMRAGLPGTMLRAQLIPSPQPPPAHSNNQQGAASLRGVQGYTMIQVASTSNPNTTVPARFAVPLKIVPSNNVQQLAASNMVPIPNKQLMSTGNQAGNVPPSMAMSQAVAFVAGPQVSSYDLSTKVAEPQVSSVPQPNPSSPMVMNREILAEKHIPSQEMKTCMPVQERSTDLTTKLNTKHPGMIDSLRDSIDPARDSLGSIDTITTMDNNSLLETNVQVSSESISVTEKKMETELPSQSGEGQASSTTTSTAPVETEETDHEFVWEEYLEETGSLAALPTSFKHVEASLKNGFTKGMKLEVLNKCHQETYWIASIMMSCGPLLRLRYDGYDDDSSCDFWCDIQTSDIHEIGWCGRNGKTLQPPEAIRNKHGSWHEFLIKTLEGAATAPPYLLDKTTGITPIDQIKAGMRVIVQHELQPLSVWIASIIQNVGGHLLLRWEGTELKTHDFWMFYLHYRIHPVGWPAKENGFLYRPPDEIKGEHNNYSKWSEILHKAQTEAEQMPVVADIFKDQIQLREHKFETGMKLEIIHPVTRTHLSPATVVQVVSKFLFILEIDDLQIEEHRTCLQVCRHTDSMDIFPAEWSLHNGVRLSPPKGWHRADFSWDIYLSHIGAEAAPESLFEETIPEHEFKRGMKLEAIDPNHPEQICAATITKIVDRIMWLHLDSAQSMAASFMVDINSLSIFPVGWCESNDYPLKPPKQSFGRSKRVAVVQPECHAGQVAPYRDNSNTWCPKIYFNHRCFSGPFLSKGRIAELPKSVGPGPVTLVLKEVLSMLINVAYKSSRVLRELQLEGTPNANMHQQILKAKYKGKSYRATVEICKTTDQLEEFCRQSCIKLECCPYLVSPVFVNGNCPENCHQLTKTKYTHYYGKKKKKNKIGRPPGGHTNLEEGNKLPGKRRKKRRHPHPSWLHGPKKTPDDIEKEALQEISKDIDAVPDNTDSLQSSNEFQGNGDDAMERKRRKYMHHIPPPSDIRTRGAKLPKYSFERRTHKKVLIEHRGGELPRKRMIKHKHHHESAMEVELEQPTASYVEYAPRLQLESNPLTWSVSKVVKFIKSTDCANLARLFRDQEIDGQAFMLLNLPSLQEHMELKLGPAIKLCHQIEKVKVAFYHQFAS